MTITSTTSTSDGVTATFSIPFPFFSRAHVSVLVDDAAYTGVVTWVSDSLVSLAPIPANGVKVTRKRITPDTPAKASFTNTNINATGLNNNQTQDLYIAQEAATEQSRALRVVAGEAGVLIGGAATRGGFIQEYNSDGTSRTDRGFATILAELSVLLGLDDLLAPLSPVADRVPYFISPTALALATFTAYARTLLDDATAAAARITLELVPGTDVQAFDADLQALGAAGSAANEVPYYTGPGAAARTPLVSQARSFLGDPNSLYVDYLQAGTGAVTRTIRAWGRERMVSVKDYGALGDGATDDTAAVQAAITAGHTVLYFPAGTYRLGQVGGLGAAGMTFKGAGRFSTYIKPIASMTVGQAIFYNQVASPATSSFAALEDMTFDLNAQNCVGIDLDRVSSTNINRVHFKGGSSLGTAVGVGIQYRATTSSGSYTNASTQCSFEALAKGVEYANGANSNSVFGGEFINCIIGADCGPGGALDTPRIIGARFEGCNVGIRERSSGANYFGCRFEAQVAADIDFISGSDRPMVLGGYTATTPIPLRTLTNAVSPIILAPDMGRYDIEVSTAPKYNHGREVFAARNTASPPATPNLEYSAYFYDTPLLRNQVGLESTNAAGTNSVIICSVDSADRVAISGFDRASGTYKRLYLGENWSSNGPGLDFAGVKVLGAQGAAVADATDAATAITQLNALLARCRAHGLIAT